jgi:hypothetical protein
MVMNFHPWRWRLYVFHPLTRRLWNFSFINVKVMRSLSTSKQKVISGNQLKDIGYWAYKTFHPPTWDYRVAFNSVIRRLCVVTQLEDTGYRNYETFHPNFSLTRSRVGSHFQTSKEKVLSGNQLKDAGYQGYETFHPNFSLTHVQG